MIYAYVRVSTEKQNLENQKLEINQFVAKNNFVIDKWVCEHISGTKNPNERALGKVIKKLKKNDILICSEISRLGRSLFMIMDILHICLSKGVIVYTVKENFHLGDDISSKVLAFAFGISAEIERKLISERTKEALHRVRLEGKKLGRPKGSKNKSPNPKIDDIAIQEYINKKMSISSIARHIDVHPNTLYKYIEHNREKFII